jgi:hypothetical protein
MELISRSSPAPLTGVRTETRIRPGLSLLRDALERARELRQDAWDCAVAIDKLHEAGLTNSELRWLVCKGYAEHAVEDVSADVSRRPFLKLANLGLPEGTCFVLTARGLFQAGRETFGVGETPGTPVCDRSDSGNSLPC